MTINQAIDLIYNYSNIDKFPEVKKLRHKLTLLKFEYGGNMKIENPKIVSDVLKSVEQNPKNLKNKN